MTSSAPPLTKYSFKSYFKGEDKAITPQGTKAIILNLSPNIFNNKVAPIEIDQELEDKSKLKEDSFQGATPEHLLIFVNAIEIINILVILSCLTPSLILEEGIILKRQVIDLSVLQSFIQKKI